MRIISVLGLLSASYVSVLSKDLTSDEHLAIGARKVEIKGPLLDNVDTEMITEKLGSSCISYTSFEDSVKNTCTWYDEYPRDRCPYAEMFENGGYTAKDMCCGCGGGIKNENLEGTYYIRSKASGTYLSIEENDVKFTSRTTRSNMIEIRYLSGEKYAVKDSTGKNYLSFYDGKVSTYINHDAWEKFEIAKSIGHFIEAEHTFMNDKNTGKKQYLAIARVGEKAVIADSVDDYARFYFEKKSESNESNDVELKNLVGMT